MIKISTRSFRDVLLHFALVSGLFLALFLAFFFVYLPWSTHHGETITVPKLAGMTTEELEDFLSDRDLRYEVSDCTFVAGVQPLTVISQYPREGAKVKQGRKIYVTITTATAPQVRMPKLTDLSYRSAEVTLRNYGLVLGTLTYRNDLAENAVLEQLYQGKKIEPGTLIAKGSKIDLVVGDGLGNTELDVPDVTGKSLDEAQLIIKGSDLQVGTIIYEASGAAPGTVIRQRPVAGQGEKIRVGDVIDLWISGRSEPSGEDGAPEGGGGDPPNQ
jgi:beta-lactam-binding protein with PASTA domain